MQLIRWELRFIYQKICWISNWFWNIVSILLRTIGHSLDTTYQDRTCLGPAADLLRLVQSSGSSVAENIYTYHGIKYV